MILPRGERERSCRVERESGRGRGGRVKNENGVERERERERERESLGVIKEKCEDPQVLGFFFYKNVILLIFNENENSKNVYSFSIFKLIFLDAKMKREYKRQGQTSILVMDPKKTKNENKIHSFFLLTKKPRFSHF